MLSNENNNNHSNRSGDDEIRDGRFSNFPDWQSPLHAAGTLSLSLRVQTVAGWSIRRLTHSSQQMLVAFATSRSTHRQHR